MSRRPARLPVAIESGTKKVFASAIDDPDTGYALTSAEVAEAARTGAQATAEVATGPCE